MLMKVRMTQYWSVSGNIAHWWKELVLYGQYVARILA